MKKKVYSMPLLQNEVYKEAICEWVCCYPMYAPADEQLIVLQEPAPQLAFK